MSFAQFIEKTTSSKIVLVEMDLGKIQTKWNNYQSGIWDYRWRISPTLKNIGDGNIGDGTIGDGEYYNFSSVGSCFASGEEYAKKTNLADCISTEKSWYYDTANRIFYVHADDGKEPQIFGIVIGITMGLSNQAKYYNDLYYEPRINGIMSIDKSKDSLYFGMISFDGGSIQCSNEDGFFDGITSYVLFGQPVRILFGGDDLAYSDFSKVFTGYIEDLNLSYDEMNISIIDDRKKFSKQLPVNKFDKTTYPNLSDDDIGKAVPLGYGEIYHAPVTCINKAQSGTPSWTFKVCDVANHANGIQSIDKVYVDGFEKHRRRPI